MGGEYDRGFRAIWRMIGPGQGPIGSYSDVFPVATIGLPVRRLRTVPRCAIPSEESSTPLDEISRKKSERSDDDGSDRENA